MAMLGRTDTSLVGRWWWTVDRWTLAAIAALIGIGGVMVLAASPAVAERIHLDAFHFVRRQAVFLSLGAVIILGVSFLSTTGIKRLGLAMLAGGLVLTLLTLFIGPEIKGATRWISFGSLSLQPSEFLKPGFAVVTAVLLAKGLEDGNRQGQLRSALLFGVVAGLLLLQPDVGMTFVVAAMWGVELFLAGLPLYLVVAVAGVMLGGGVGAYFAFEHVQLRVDRFFDPSAEGYQVGRALQAFRDGGLFGVGPGEGHVKDVLPDAHADFVFAVTGEEFGMIACLVIVALFTFVVVRGFSRVFKHEDMFRVLAVTGLLVQFGLQALINMASTTNLIPPKGMTLPFISYGGSSTLSLAIAVGMVLALTRSRPGEGGAR